MEEKISGGLKTPVEWGKELAITVMDPDGWRKRNLSFDDPITKE